MSGNNGVLARHPISPEELAAALRGGLESRRMTPAVTAPPPPPPVPAEAPFHHVWQYAGLLGHPAPPAGGPIKMLVRLARRVLKKFLNPWLDLQTKYNHALLAELQARSQPAPPPAAPPADLYALLRRLQDRLNECHHKIETLSAGRAGEADRKPQPADALEDVFIQTRMPDPPGAALVLGDNAYTPGVLEAVGYTVLHAPAADLAALPLKAGAFRVVLALGHGGTESSLWAAGA